MYLICRFCKLSLKAATWNLTACSFKSSFLTLFQNSYFISKKRSQCRYNIATLRKMFLSIWFWAVSSLLKYTYFLVTKKNDLSFLVVIVKNTWCVDDNKFSNPIWFGHPNSIWWREHFIKFLTVPFPPAAWAASLLRPNIILGALPKKDFQFMLFP